MKHPEGDFPTPVSENAEGIVEPAPDVSEWAAPQVPSEWQAPGSFSAPVLVAAPESDPSSATSVDEPVHNAENGTFEAAESDSPENPDTGSSQNGVENAQDGSQEPSWTAETVEESAPEAFGERENTPHEQSVDNEPVSSEADTSGSVDPTTSDALSFDSAGDDDAGFQDGNTDPVVESDGHDGPAEDEAFVEVAPAFDGAAAHEGSADEAATDEIAGDETAGDETEPDETAGDETAGSAEDETPDATAVEQIAHESTVAETLAAAHVPVAEPLAAAVLDDTPLARELAEITRRRQALNAQSLPLPDAPRIFTVANQKGGVGKTTTTVNLAAALARGGARVLVIDLDPQGNASTALGVEHRADTVSVYDVIINDAPIAEVVQKSPEFAGLYCVPATIHLAGAEIELVSLVAREQRLRTSLDLFLSEAEEPFHYVFIDCPPSLGLLTINAFVAAREVLIPIQCEYYALEGLSQLLSNIQLIERHLNPRLTVSTILLTMYDGRTNLANQVADDVREHFPREVLDTLIPRSVRISEAPSYGQSVISYDPSSPGSLSYLEAAAEIAKRGAPA